jgi:hypothetical protein
VEVEVLMVMAQIVHLVVVQEEVLLVQLEQTELLGKGLTAE